MKLKTALLLTISHLIIGTIGFAAGIFALPILTAPPAPTATEVAAVSAQASYTAIFKRNLKGSDALHWGEGEVFLSQQAISLNGAISPGPDFKLYLSPEFVETEAQFEQLKSSMVQVGDVKTFNNFLVKVEADIDLEQYNTVVVWCESFGEFITAASYR